MSLADITANPTVGLDAPAQRLESLVHGDSLGGFDSLSDIAACLVPLLKDLGWRGNPRHVAEALPHFADSLDEDGLRAVLANLNYATRPIRIELRALDPRLAPFIFVPDTQPAMVVLGQEGPLVTIFNGATSMVENIEPKGIRGVAHIIENVADGNGAATAKPQPGNWFEGTARRFRGLVMQMLGITCITSLLALAVPLFIMTVYDKVLGSGSQQTLYYLAAGVCLALAADMGLRLIRGRILAYIGGRIDMILGTAAFQQILHLPVLMTERATIGSQVTRLRQFEAVREFFIGPMAGVVLDLPFAVIFVAVIALVGGHLAWIPIVLIALFAVIGLLVTPVLRRRVSRSSDAKAKRQGFLIEMLSQLRTIKFAAAEKVWSERYRHLSAAAAQTNFRTNQVTLLVQTVAQMLMLSAGIATLGVGTLLVLDAQITVGQLIASMALTWRVLSPLQTAFLSLTRIEQIKLGLRQMNQLMKLTREREPGRVVDRFRGLRGAITFNRVSLRYTPKSEPALLAVNFRIEPGEFVALSGPNGAGKSSILKTIAGLYTPQAGGILVDGIDTRQIDIGELRENIAYVPQACHLLYGTIAQNLRLSNPTASDADLAQAALDAGLMEDILTMPEGFDTRLTDRLQRQLPNGVKQRIMLARAFVKTAPIYLMDEPANHLDFDGDATLMRTIQKLRGKATIVAVTHRPSHMRQADKIIYIEGGQVILAGPPADVLPKIGMG